MKSYTYLIGWSSLGKWYYGVRYANKVEPELDLWGKYFTSSKIVKAMRKEHGEPDVVQVRRKFDDPEQARAWEERVLRRMNCVKSDSWLNQCIGGKKFHVPGKRDPSIGKKISESLTGRTRPEFSEEWKRKLSEGKKGKPVPKKQGKSLPPKSEKSKQKMRDAWTPERRAKQAEIGRSVKHDHMTGKKHSPETLQRMREAWVRRKDRQPFSA